MKQTKDKDVYLAVCPAHDFEGMRREAFGEAALDLSGHFELFPNEGHAGARIKQESVDGINFVDKEFELAKAKPGSAHVKSVKGSQPRWHRKDRFDLGKFGGIVEVKGIVGQHVFDEKLVCVREDGQEFVFKDIHGMFAEKQELPAGRYIMKLFYKWSEFTGRPTFANVTVFIHWKPFKEEQEW